MLHVDPTCPFAWITSEWLREVEQQRAAGLSVVVERRLMSLSAVNEDRALDPWYRDYNDRAWRPARVASALLASPDAGAWQEFYAGFGRRRHVEGLRDDDENLRLTIEELGLPPGLALAADDPHHDDDLRRRTGSACDAGAGLEGTPMLHVDGRPCFGPVLTAVPRGMAAARLWDAVGTLVGTPAFAELRTVRGDDLRTS